VEGFMMDSGGAIEALAGMVGLTVVSRRRVEPAVG
jgi:hypothetical protein